MKSVFLNKQMVMNAFIEKVQNSLMIMIEIRQDYINYESELWNNCDDYTIHNRIFQIYSTDTPQILVNILYKLKLIDENEAYGQHNVSSVFSNFARYETIPTIIEAYNKYYKDGDVETDITQLRFVCEEMQECFAKLQLVA